MVIMKTCSKCKTEKPATFEYFGKRSLGKDGLKCECKECVKKYNGKRYENNKEHYKQLNDKWRKENKSVKKKKEIPLPDKPYLKEFIKRNRGYYGK